MFERDAEGQHPVLAAAAAAAAQVLGSSGLSLSTGDVRTALVELHAAQAAVEVARLHLVRMLEAREESPLHPGGATVAWMTHHLRIGRTQARADLAAARAADPHDGALRGLGAAVAEGAASRAHLDVAVRSLRQLPTGLVTERRPRRPGPVRGRRV